MIVIQMWDVVVCKVDFTQNLHLAWFCTNPSVTLAYRNGDPNNISVGFLMFKLFNLNILRKCLLFMQK